jgi:hypothetical protein
LRSGNACKFVSMYTYHGNQRLDGFFGDDTASLTFSRTPWGCLLFLSTSIANLEMDLNQVTANSQIAIYGPSATAVQIHGI